MSARVRLKARWRLARGAVKSFLWLVAAVVLIGLLVLRTGLGHRTVLQWALDQARSRVDGRIEVDRIRSANLLRGARLGGVRLLTTEGDTLLSVDSLEVSYRVPSLVRGNLVFSGLRLWNPELHLVRFPDEDRGNLARWLGSGPGRGDGGPGPTVAFGDVYVHGGAVTVVSPLSSPADTAGPLRWQSTPRGAVRRLELERIEAHLPIVAVNDGEALSVDVSALAMEAHVLAEPMRVHALTGGIRIAQDTLTLTLAPAAVDDMVVRGHVTLPPVAEEEGRTVALDLGIEGLELARYRWLAAALPALEGRVHVRGSMGPAGQRWTFTELDAALDGGRVRGSGTVALRDGTRLESVALDLTDVPLTVLEPWLEGDSLPVRGRVAGSVRLTGPLTALATEARLRLTGGEHAPAEGEFRGTILRPPGGELGVRDASLTLEAFDWSLVSAFAPGISLSGPGRVRLTATGSLDQGLRFDADLTHVPVGAPTSHVLASGSVRRTSGAIALDIQADLSPLSFTALRGSYPDLPLSGEVAGAVRARGLVRDLEVRAEVDTELGRMDVTGRFDARDPAAAYRIEGTVQDFLASALVPALPEPSRVTGRIEVAGRGRTASDVAGDARLELGRSSFAALEVDTLRLAARVHDGVLTLDTLTGRAAGFTLEAGGTLAVDEARPSGEIRVDFATESLVGIRPLLMGERVIAADTLGPLERELLRLSGVEPDTLPVLADVQMDGQAHGALTLAGSVRDFSAEGEVTLEELRYGQTTLASATLVGLVEGLPGLDGRAQIEVELGAAQILGRSFTGGRGEVDFLRPEGSAVVELSRSEDEDYRARASFDVDSLGGTVLLEELGLRFDDIEYSLSAPASLAWTDSSVTVRDFELIRPGSDPESLRADGTISWRGQVDFALTSQGIPLERLLQLAQREDLDMSGRVDLDMTVAGTAASPTIEGTFSGEQVRARTAELSRVDGVFTYRDRGAELSLEAWRDELRILEVSGSVPVDLALGSVADRTPAGDMDLRIRADSLPAVFVLSLLEDLENVEGTVTGDVNVAGSLDDPEPRGTLHLRGGAWTVGALGVRQSAVEATLELAADGVVAVQATGRAGGGRASVEGSVTVSPLADPGLDLAIRLDRFRAVDRRDVEGTVSGDVQLTQRFRRPVITGDLRVDEGILHLEEFQRSAGVVDLADPRFFTYVDTSLLSGRPLLAGTRNPFMDSLRVNVQLAVDRGTFLRSRQMNVEIGGDLIVTYDRAAQDIVMIGELEAVRGQYTFLSRTFDVRSGTVDFLGTPGINPNLNIQAVARVRRREADPLDITANLTGTLVDPRVRLSAEGQAISESDLISYLVFGRPSSEFNSFFAGGRGGTGGMSEGLLGEGASFLSSTLAASLASLAQGIGWVDYLSVSQTADVSASSGGLSPFAGTQVEIGQYFLGGDYFAAVTLRPLSGTGQSSNILGGFRLEWQASDQYHVEAFAEDRFLRGGGYGFQELGIRSSLIYGLSLFREWGY